MSILRSIIRGFRALSPPDEPEDCPEDRQAALVFLLLFL